MSLIEQALARLKKEQGQPSAAGERDRGPRADAHVHDIALRREAERPANRIAVDTEALRAAGYLPEPGTERLLTDQYRRIKRPLIERALLSDPEAENSRVVVVSSALPGDGKTFTAVNLALNISLERDVSVLLIDADGAKREVTRIFGLDKQPGLFDLLADEGLSLATVIVPTTTRGLSILPAGGRLPNRAELLNSYRMRRIVADLCAHDPKRMLILDSPPLLVTNEAGALVKIAGQAVMVVRAGHTPQRAVHAAVALLDANQAGGIVLNEVLRDSPGEYYGYGSYGTDSAQT